MHLLMFCLCFLTLRISVLLQVSLVACELSMLSGSVMLTVMVAKVPPCHNIGLHQSLCI